MFKLLLVAIAALVFFTAPVVIPAALWLMKGAPMGSTEVSSEFIAAERQLREQLEGAPAKLKADAGRLAHDAGESLSPEAEKARKRRATVRRFRGGEL